MLSASLNKTFPSVRPGGQDEVEVDEWRCEVVCRPLNWNQWVVEINNRIVPANQRGSPSAEVREVDVAVDTLFWDWRMLVKKL